jgi:peroxiredoxin
VVARCTKPSKGDKTVWDGCSYKCSFIFATAIYTHMKHIILPSFAFIIVLLACSGPSKNKVEEPLPPATNDLPKMTVITSSRSEVNLNQLKGNTILILFQPDCDHCQREAKEIRQHLDEFKDYALYFISADQLQSIEAFGKSYDLLGHINVNFASTTVDDVIKNFGPIPAPSVYIYSDQKLVKKFNGEVAIEMILQAI